MRIIKESDKGAVRTACDFLREGKIISFASDTVYGLAVDASNSVAVEALYKIKKRDKKKPIAVFVENLVIAENFLIFDELSKEIARKFLPGNLTLVLKKEPEASSFLSPNLNQSSDQFLGFRIIDRKFVQILLHEFGGVLAVTSANPSGQKAAENAFEVKKYYKESALSLLIESDCFEKQVPSTVAKIFENKLTILRQGSLNLSAYENY